MQQHVILASRSPRRTSILRGLDFDFEVIPAADDVEGRVVAEDPFARAIESARLKAQDVAAKHSQATVIGADTIVLLGDEVLEKPRDDAQAESFLRGLSGREHTVVTGVAVVRGDAEVADAERTAVRFRELSDREIHAYVASGEGRDKAGSYAVQGLGAGLVSSINGCFYNVVGLPVSLLFDLLRKVRT